jgi:pilus assembly protein CpaE
MNNLRITVISPDKHHLDEIQRVLHAAADTRRVSAIEGSLRRLGEHAKQLAADILIADCSGDGSDELAPLEQMGELGPRTAIIVLCKKQSPEFLIRAMRLGVREVIAAPVDTLALEAAIERISSRSGLPDTVNAKVLAFMSCKGGSGATFLASNLASVLAAHGDAKVALFDLNLQFGDAHMFLSERQATHTLSDVVRGIHRLDSALLKASMMNFGPNLAVLAAPEDPSQGMQAGPEHIETLLAVARRHYDYVILDVGRTLDAPTVRALDQADLIYAVLQANLPFVRGAKRMLEMFRSLEYPEHKVELVINRYEKSGDLGIKDIEAALGKRIRRTMPNDYGAVTASVNQGVPIEKLARGSPVSGALMDWSAQLQGKQPAQEENNWIARVFKRA